MRLLRFLAPSIVSFAAIPCFASIDVSLFSGTFDGEHPSPTLIAKVSRGDRFTISLIKASALVNYPDPENQPVVERVQTFETGANLTCPWYLKLDGSPTGTRVDQPYNTSINKKVTCDDAGCKDLIGRPLPTSELLYGKYHLPKCKRSDGTDAGFNDLMWIETPTKDCKSSLCSPKIETVQICCPEFSVERTYSEMHYFDQLLIVDNFREQEITDLDVDFRKFYVTFENEKKERANCALTDLLSGGDTIEIADLKDCILPPGNSFTLYGQSRFFLKDTRPCGKFVTRGVKGPDGYSPDWFMGWYECDGKIDRRPILKQFTYSTHVDLTFTPSDISGDKK